MRRGVIAGGVVAFVFALHCGSTEEARYTPASDDAFVASIEGEYSGESSSGPVRLTLCEDRGDPALVCMQPDVGRAYDCPASCHWIRGRGLGREQTMEVDTDGCDCPGARAEMAVTVELARAGGAAALRGTLSMNARDGEPYGAPIRLFAYGDTTRRAPANLRGAFQGPGRLEVDVRVATAAAPAVGVGEAGADAGAEDAGAVAPDGGTGWALAEEITFVRARGAEACRASP